MSYHIKLKLVDSYLSGIYNQLEHYFPDVHTIFNSLLVRKTLKGCMQLHGTAVKHKLPLTQHELQLVLDKFNPSLSHNDSFFLAMILTGLYGLLQFADLSMPDSIELW
ncbi:hypothetical protein EDD18DRAFT_1360650 [Armillaria luteobubalina]|uniref:Uncharacterized protein n=1 Tax=Armillaria luteobubalina TaxID=153913 RepID=A0AA39UEW4_9AGAR|nr:hypothetical protein EDD18DRAFT_1360650 [Armillaria luteobubalina]